MSKGSTGIALHIHRFSPSREIEGAEITFIAQKNSEISNTYAPI